MLCTFLLDQVLVLSLIAVGTKPIRKFNSSLDGSKIPPSRCSSAWEDDLLLEAKTDDIGLELIGVVPGCPWLNRSSVPAFACMSIRCCDNGMRRGHLTDRAVDTLKHHN